MTYNTYPMGHLFLDTISRRGMMRCDVQMLNHASPSLNELILFMHICIYMY